MKRIVKNKFNLRNVHGKNSTLECPVKWKDGHGRAAGAVESYLGLGRNEIPPL